MFQSTFRHTGILRLIQGSEQCLFLHFFMMIKPAVASPSTPERMTPMIRKPKNSAADRKSGSIAGYDYEEQREWKPQGSWAG
jgi:hypothetical protein